MAASLDNFEFVYTCPILLTNLDFVVENPDEIPHVEWKSVGSKG